MVIGLQVTKASRDMGGGGQVGAAVGRELRPGGLVSLYGIGRLSIGIGGGGVLSPTLVRVPTYTGKSGK